jgi:hypothetical protein
VHVVARLDSAEHGPEPGVRDDGHRPDGRHAVDRLEASEDGLAELAARIRAQVCLLEQVAVQRLELGEAIDHRRVEEEHVVPPAADGEQVLDVADQLRRQLLRCLELVREPLRKIGANGIALGGEERNVLGHLVNERPRGR